MVVKMGSREVFGSSKPNSLYIGILQLLPHTILHFTFLNVMSLFLEDVRMPVDNNYSQSATIFSKEKILVMP